MYRERIVAVVVPAHNEEVLIARTLGQMPDFVDHVVVVDDKSTDRTAAVVEALAANDKRIELIRHERNGGVGAAISTGYVWCREHGVDLAAVMAGDAQMDPADLPALLDPVVEDRADYTKGNRLVTGEAWNLIPHSRYLGNSALTFMTKIASGYWHVTDSQTGYTVLNRKALDLLPLESIYPRYGMPNDFLVTLNIFNMRVMDVPVHPVYRIGERSGIRIPRVMVSLTFLLTRLFLRRMVQKYIIRDFHPLVLFYAFGSGLLLLNIPLMIRLIIMTKRFGVIPEMNALTITLFTVLGFQSLLFAMLFDMEANRDLKGK